MAGDWIKMEIATPEKSETLAITAAMGWDDPDLAVGKLFRVWRWFDQHTVDGNAPGVTSALLDRFVAAPGFAEAMRAVGWLAINADGITLPNFDRHNGATAKARALTAKRVNKFKGGNAKGNGGNVTRALPREEKRREEKIETKTTRATTIPKPFIPGDSVKRWAAEKFPTVNFEEEVGAFVDHHTAKGSPFKDWDAALRTWIRYAAKWARKPAVPAASPVFRPAPRRTE